jgi:hypothetical protein
MSDDLISRKSVVEWLESLINEEITTLFVDNIIHVMAENFKEHIENMQVAYDVDKVVEQLEHIANHYECEEQGREDVYMVDLEPAIEIIRGGGIDEKR